jgi:hypothetical protein
LHTLNALAVVWEGGQLRMAEGLDYGPDVLVDF